jgi:hypothetical protein
MLGVTAAARDEIGRVLRSVRKALAVTSIKEAWLSGGLAGQPDRTAGADRQVVAGGQGRGQGIELRDVTGTELVLQAVPGAAEG